MWHKIGVTLSARYRAWRADFEGLGRILSPQYRVIALDFTNQGNSGADSQPASGTRYSKLLSDFIDRLNLQSVTLLGNSIGAATAIRYTHLYPERVRARVVRQRRVRSFQHEIRCPVLLAWAKNDIVIPLKRSEPSFEQFPNHHLEVFEGGHAAFLEDPDRFEQSLRKFFNGL